MPDYKDELEQIVAELNRTATGPAAAADRPERRTWIVPDAEEFAPVSASGLPAVNPEHLEALDRLLGRARERKASDILLVAGAPAALRVTGSLLPGSGPALSAEETRDLLLSVLPLPARQQLEQTKAVDLSFSRPELGRYRANVHYQRGTLAGSIRLLPEKIPTIESLNLPPSLRELADARQGLVLLTGPTGCGKSSTLAALMDRINSNRRHHVVTIEDPVEFVHTNRSSIIEQIEVGRDAPDFASSVRSILRQNPDVILVGEIRDAETMATVLTAAETGHLVLSTLHTNDTSQAVSRVLDMFPAANQAQMRQQLSLALLAVVAQQLVPDTRGHRYPAVEILRGSSGIRSLIRRGEDHQLYTAISTGRADGMITMEQSLAELVERGRITREVALTHCFRRQDLERYF